MRERLLYIRDSVDVMIAMLDVVNLSRVAGFSFPTMRGHNNERDVYSNQDQDISDVYENRVALRVDCQGGFLSRGRPFCRYVEKG